MLSPEEQENAIKNLLVASVFSRVEVQVLLTAVEELSKSLGQPKIEGMTFSDWFHKNRYLALQHELIQIENLDPALAAMLQERIDRLKMGGGISDSEE